MTDLILIVVFGLLGWAFFVAAKNKEPRCDHRLEGDMDEDTGEYFRSCGCGQEVQR